MKTYITKLNDRNLQRKKANGITNYVLYSVLIIIIFKILSIAKTIPFKSNFWEIMEILMYTFNFSFAVFFIYVSFMLSLKNSSSLRVLSNEKKSNSYFMALIIFAIFSLSIITTALISWHTYNIKNEFSRTLITLISINTITLLLILTSIIKPNKPDTIKIFSGTNIRTEVELVMSIGILIISIIIIYVTGYSLFISELKIDIFNIFIFGLMSFSILIIISLIIERIGNDVFARDLENLEYEIYVNNLDDDQIRSILQNKYMGFLLSDWIKNKYSLVQKEYIEFNNLFKIIKKGKENLLNVNKHKHPYEYKGQKDEIIKNNNTLKQEIENLFESNIQEIDNIIQNKFRVNSSEKQELLKYKTNLHSDFKKYKKLITNSETLKQL